jgi:hypothetical protein
MDGVIERLPHVYFEKEALLTRDRGAADRRQHREAPAAVAEGVASLCGYHRCRSVPNADGATIHRAFEHGAQHYVIKKSLLRSLSAVLTEDGREIARFAKPT